MSTQSMIGQCPLELGKTRLCMSVFQVMLFVFFAEAQKILEYSGQDVSFGNPVVHRVYIAMRGVASLDELFERT